MALSDNDKAASFIGWSPSQDSDKIPPCKQAELKHKFGVYLPAKAPDMTRPENYMRALEALPKNYYWEFSRNCAEGHNCQIITPNDRVISGSYPVDTLAALYDAEHGGSNG